MKRSLFLLQSLFIFQSCSQNFEGVVYYETHYHSLIDTIPDDYLFGEQVGYDTTYYKYGYFLSKSSTEFMKMMLWRSEDTTVYYQNGSNKDTTWFTKTYSTPSEIDSFKIITHAAQILEYDCDQLMVYRKGRIYNYYYHPAFKLDPVYYDQFTNSAKNEIMRLMQSPYLKLDIISDKNRMIMTATSVQTYDLPDQLFTVPKNTILLPTDF